MARETKSLPVEYGLSQQSSIQQGSVSFGPLDNTNGIVTGNIHGAKVELIGMAHYSCDELATKTAHTASQAQDNRDYSKYSNT